MKSIYSVYIVSSILISILFISGSLIGYGSGAELIGAPDAPVELIADTESNNVYLTWEPPLDDGGDPIINYHVYRGNIIEDIVYLTEVGDVTEFNDDGVHAGETYYYQVSAENSYEEGVRSDEINVVLETPQESQYAVSGYVMDHETSENIPDAYIELWDTYNDDNYNANSNSNGYFSLNLPPGTYEVTITAPDYQESIQNMEVSGDRSDLNYYITSEFGSDVLPDEGGSSGNNNYIPPDDGPGGNSNDPGSDGSNDGTDSGNDGNGEGGGFDGLPADLEGQLQTVLMVSFLFILVLLISLITTALACIAIFVRLGKIKKELNGLQEANNQAEQRNYRDDYYSRDPNYNRDPDYHKEQNHSRPPPPPPKR